MSNQYTYTVPFSEQELLDCYIVRGMSQAEIATLYGTSQHVVWRAMKKMGVPSRRAVARNQATEANNNWRGGRILQGRNANHGPYNDRGYWYIYDPTHPNATTRGYIAEHIAVATKQAGRVLLPGECVHHINLLREDNSPGNLLIVGRQQHALLHAQLEQVAAGLLAAGVLTFNSTSGYSLAE